MFSQETTLFLKLSQLWQDRSKHIVFVGLGNKLRCDDAVGCYIVNQLKEKINLENFHFFDVGETVENYLTKILSVKPEYIIFVDAVKGNSQEENFLLLSPDKLQNYTFSTHNISLPTIVEYISKYVQEEFSYKPTIYVLAVKIKSTEFAEQLTEETKTIADEFVENFVKLLLG